LNLIKRLLFPFSFREKEKNTTSFDIYMVEPKPLALFREKNNILSLFLTSQNSHGWDFIGCLGLFTTRTSSTTPTHSFPNEQAV